jgi:hypothetical protein
MFLNCIVLSCLVVRGRQFHVLLRKYHLMWHEQWVGGWRAGTGTNFFYVMIDGVTT